MKSKERGIRGEEEEKEKVDGRGERKRGKGKVEKETFTGERKKRNDVQKTEIDGN